MAERELVEIRSRAELHSWLQEHHQQTESVWLVTYKKHVSERYVAWGEIVQEALCFGWIDGQVKSLGPDRVKHLFSPRRRGSHWSAVNKRHIDKLEADGFMEPAGRAVIEAAKADGSWVWLDEIEALVEPPDLVEALSASPAARATWDDWSKSQKKIALHHLKSAKRPATRSKRLAKVLAAAESGKTNYS